MKITTRCVPCLLERIRYQSELKDPERGPSILGECLRILAREYGPERCSAEVATLVHRKSHEMLGFDPYKEMKEESNRVVMELLPRARTFIEKGSDRLEAALTVAIVGNVMDFGISDRWHSPECLRDRFDDLLAEGLGYSDLSGIREYLGEGKRILYLTDNCGEVVLDGLLMEELKALGCTLGLVVKGEAILTDATMEDVGLLGLDEVADDVLTTGKFAVGLDLRDMPNDLRKWMDSADIILSKGMANFEALSEAIPLPTAFLLRTKCLPVATALGLPVEINAAKLVLPGEM